MSRIVPGADECSFCSESDLQNFTRRSPRKLKAPGCGLKLWMWARTCSDGRSQSMAASAVLILVAYVIPTEDWGRGTRVSNVFRDSTSSLLPSSPNLASRLPLVSAGEIDVDTRARTSPVSRPSSICIKQTPDSVSPASMDRAIGAAPRQRGKSDA